MVFTDEFREKLNKQAEVDREVRAQKALERQQLPRAIDYRDHEFATKVQVNIKEKISFEILAVGGNMKEAVLQVERAIEGVGLKCRIYTRGRIASAGASVLGGLTGLAGLGSAVYIAAHNVSTFNPDYEIAKHVIDNKLSVTWMH